jgi:hypothetical protein
MLPQLFPDGETKIFFLAKKTGGLHQREARQILLVIG